MRYPARLDDLRPNRQRSAAFTDQAGSIVAVDQGEVLPALEELEQAAAAGLWAIGYIGYEAAHAIDRHLVVRSRHSDFHAHLPLLWFGLYETRVLNPVPESGLGSYQITEWDPVDEPSAYEAAIARVREHIILGDTYQVNLTTRLRARFTGDPLAFYHDLAAAQSGAYGTYLDAGRFKIASASPELFFDRYPTTAGPDRLITRPMKGTAPRGRWAEDDLARYHELEASEKDRAENLIIVDLLRNDVGRVAEFGSVEVTDLLAIERYDTVWQMTSTITGAVDPEVPLLDVLRALFPCGSITGAPKVRTMQIIRDLETEPRGVYTGAIGFVAPKGAKGPRASFSVGIRTVVIDSETGDAEYGIGGGITYDSDPHAELEEAMLKARILDYGRSDFELLETLRWNPVTGWFWLDRHLARLETSAEYFAIATDRDEVIARLEAAVGGEDDLRVRLTVDRLGRIRVSVEPLVEDERRSVAVAIDEEPVDTSDPFLFHKTTRRAVYEERLVRHPDAEDVILVNEEGELTESTIANIAVKLDGTWYTPPVAAGCLPGVYRASLLEEGRLVERPIPRHLLDECEGIALLNSVRLWRPAFVVSD
ncbi:MAG: aminodeoxychorismate synthase component I [Acidimicrobiia bacterium]|nr:aminodeoxychorismate synthase component I [Acidimicrobiia bacterium]